MRIVFMMSVVVMCQFAQANSTAQPDPRCEGFVDPTIQTHFDENVLDAQQIRAGYALVRAAPKVYVCSLDRHQHDKVCDGLLHEMDITRAMLKADAALAERLKNAAPFIGACAWDWPAYAERVLSS